MIVQSCNFYSGIHELLHDLSYFAVGEHKVTHNLAVSTCYLKCSPGSERKPGLNFNAVCRDFQIRPWHGEPMCAVGLILALAAHCIIDTFPGCALLRKRARNRQQE